MAEHHWHIDGKTQYHFVRTRQTIQAKKMKWDISHSPSHGIPLGQFLIFYQWRGQKHKQKPNHVIMGNLLEHH